LLRKIEADNAAVELAADDYSLFRTRDFTTEVTRDSLSMATRSEEFELSLREIFSRTLRLLRHTPVTDLTVSRFKYWRPDPSTKDFEEGLDWSALVMVSKWSKLIVDPSPRGVAIRGRTATGISVTMAIEPELSNSDLVYVGCRYDWKLTESDGMTQLLRILDDDWTTIRKHADDVSQFALHSLLPTRRRKS
jgi:hypothetical protein